MTKDVILKEFIATEKNTIFQSLDLGL